MFVFELHKLPASV